MKKLNLWKGKSKRLKQKLESKRKEFKKAIDDLDKVIQFAKIQRINTTN